MDHQPKSDALFAQARQIDLRTHRVVNDLLVGRYRSAFRGRGLEFDQVREYSPGDDVRAIDWNVTAREGRPYVKTFVEERALTLMLAVDVSGSQDFGSTATPKRQLAAELASVLALAGTRTHDRVGLILFSDRIEKVVPPRRGRNHAGRVVQEILGVEPAGRGTDIAQGVEVAATAAVKHGILIVVSDFELGGAPEHRKARLDAMQHVLLNASLRHDVVAVRVRDPRESQLVDVGVIAVEDAETGEVVELDTSSRRVRERYAELAAARADEVTQALRAARTDLVEVNPESGYLQPLVQFFAERRRRASR